MTLRLLVLASLAACSPKVPAHLRIDTPQDQSKEAGFTDLASLVGVLVGSDPLVRAPGLPDIEVAAAIDRGIAAWAEEIQQLEQGNGRVHRQLQLLEKRHPGTAVVALSRGYRLRMAENHLGNLIEAGEDSSDAVAVLLTPLDPSPASASLAKAPLRFLHPDGTDRQTAVRDYGDRWVLAAWLHAPDIPTDAVAAALSEPQWDGLAGLGIGRILRSRHATGDASEGRALLQRATLLSLTRTAADRDHEQAAWADMLLDEREKLGTEKPIPLLLERALDGLLVNGADDEDAGRALIAATALRWLDACGAPPCNGLDRTELFHNAERWGPETARLARVWQVIALKDAVDTMEVGHDTILFPTAAVGLTDALLGTGAGPLDTGILRRSRGDEAVWLAVSRAVGGDPSTDWEGARAALRGHLEKVARRAIEDLESTEFKPLLERIADRAGR